jgi:hypothetical protein
MTESTKRSGIDLRLVLVVAIRPRPSASPRPARGRSTNNDLSRHWATLASTSGDLDGAKGDLT